MSFSQTKFTVNEHHGVVTANMTLSRPTPCCLHLYVEVEDITATSKIKNNVHKYKTFSVVLCMNIMYAYVSGLGKIT